MKRFGLGLLAVVLTLAAARADIAVPPPKGMKFVTVKTSLKLEKESSDYVFYTRAHGLRDGPVTKLEVGTEKAVALPAGGKFGLQLLAVPTGVVKKFDNEKELLEKLSDKTDGVLVATFDRSATLPVADKRTEIGKVMVVTGIDAKKGIEMKEEKAEKDAPKAAEDEPLAVTTGRPEWLIGGLALSLAVVGGGLWFARRGRKAA